MLAMLVKLSYYAHNYAHDMQRYSYIEQRTDIVKHERQLANNYGSHCEKCSRYCVHYKNLGVSPSLPVSYTHLTLPTIYSV